MRLSRIKTSFFALLFCVTASSTSLPRGYGRDPQTLEEYYQRLEQQVNVLLAIPHIAGFCYTQIVDVELEKNGIFTYDRQPKFDQERIRRIFTKSRDKAKEEVKQMLKEK